MPSGIYRRPSPLEKIITHSAPSKGCRIWMSTIQNGYGLIHINGKHRRAHRWLYEFFNGKLAKKLDIDHLCSNRRCIRLGHLEPVTRSENIQRTYDRGLRPMIADGKYAKKKKENLSERNDRYQ